MTETLPLVAEHSAQADRVPLTLQQEFLRLMDSGTDSGPFGPRYTIVAGWRVFGHVHVDTMRAALTDVIARHETLRTRIVIEDGEAHQHILPASPPEVLITDLSARTGDRDRIVEEYLNEVEAGVSVPNETPRLKVALGRFDDTDGVLVFVAHHTVVDGASVHVVFNDFAECYAARRAGREPALPEVRQYREYVEWQQATADGPEVKAAREFWREYLRGAHMLPIRTDRMRSEGGYVTGWYRFMLEEDFRQATLAAAKQTRSTPFMVLLAAFVTLMRERTGETDIVVPTLMSGRQPGWTQNMVGVFYNFMPLRVDIAGCTTFPEVVARVRASCLAAYPHELPFMQLAAEAPELMATVAVPDAAAIAFQVIQHPAPLGGERVGDLRYVAIRRRVVSTPVGSQIPDGILAELDLHPEGGMFGKVAFVKSLYDEDTISAMMADFGRVLRSTIGGPA
jgi:condensation enzyme